MIDEAIFIYTIIDGIIKAYSSDIKSLTFCYISVIILSEIVLLLEDWQKVLEFHQDLGKLEQKGTRGIRP